MTPSTPHMQTHQHHPALDGTNFLVCIDCDFRMSISEASRLRVQNEKLVKVVQGAIVITNGNMPLQWKQDAEQALKSIEEANKHV